MLIIEKIDMENTKIFKEGNYTAIGLNNKFTAFAVAAG